MKTKLTPLFAILLASLLLCTAACGDPTNEGTDSTADSAANTNAAATPSETLAINEADTAENVTDANTSEHITEATTDLPVYPGDIELDLPDLRETSKVTLSVKNGSILGMDTLLKPMDGAVIGSYTDFQKRYGIVEGIDEAFFETHILRLVHTAQSSSSTRYAVDKVTLDNGTFKVEIIEQHAAMATRDLQYHYVFLAMEKAQSEANVEIHVTGVQLAR